MGTSAICNYRPRSIYATAARLPSLWRGIVGESAGPDRVQINHVRDCCIANQGSGTDDLNPIRFVAHDYVAADRYTGACKYADSSIAHDYVAGDRTSTNSI